ncbi:DUF5989 family protein [Methylocystis sp. 9N]|uniref:DUF5989 family protein n=1 Tax=Methylocystis borbori TaxID=3118750 RepID=A0ABU7XCY8_9HYPH
MSFIKELFAYLIAQKKFWLFPLIMLFAIIGAIFVVSQGSVVAPFIYTLF